MIARDVTKVAVVLLRGGMATTVQQKGAEIAAGAEAGIPSSLQLQQLLQESCDLAATTPFLIQLNATS